MMNHSLKNQFKLNPGTVIEGKWHHNRYTILKELGLGANGIVFLANSGGQRVALKMSDNSMSVTSEVNVLKSFAKVPGSALGPSLLDVDDWIWSGRQVSFYVMEFIEGPDLLTFIQEKGPSWTEVVILQLLGDLHKLHESGWVFGDLKPENLIVTGPPPRIRCIDVGGTTIQGRAIKEFTEFFDRGYWGLGSRKADPTYDLFAVAMILINIAYPKRFHKTSGDLKQLIFMVRQKKELLKFEGVILKALQGKFNSAEEMRQSILQLNRPQPQQKPQPQKVNSTPQRKQTQAQKNNTTVSRQSYIKKKKKRGGALETVLIFLIISLLYVIYIYGQLV
ncbi:protein kinase family protein [Bacillus sp. DTU_2020_1000418_1_SI_GHA_SEK_038]|uniref:serine/threonine protein kinase n=1 Tax=Bacillus sp. DTU_2020_1000418_1_SI_GHA_SEK_038 TaxID=3077585 RepID=UPI0028E1C2E1|nr:protein kinase family protein [Bacillus sp. DTU_2020_1000418_1_SI_GHA_SEK_038]WNS75562.1 protein kinase family protein [Bacillus sp. DTU_2020_1000418_1_SI_GHA_SEK_038]